MAKRFEFRAQAVLTLREQREQTLRRQFADAQGRLTAIETRIREIRQELSRQDDQVRAGVLTGTVDVQYMSLYRRHTLTLHRAMVQQVGLYREAAAAVQQARTELAAAAREHKVLQTYRDRLRQRHMEGLRRDEQRTSDEMTSLRFARNMEDAQP